MGGQEGSRGYLFQAIIATLDSLNKNNWETVAIEPSFENDKVDIVWSENEQTEIVYQVKSSINNFEKSDILTWLLDLTSHSTNAREFKLVLIGSCSGPTKRFFNDFASNATIDALELQYRPLISLKERIFVEIRTFDLDTFESAINSKVYQFLSERKLKLDFPTIELIADGLKVQFLRFSTHGKKMSKKEFSDKLLNWIEYNYPSYIKKIENDLRLDFYLSRNLPFTDCLEQNFAIPEIKESDFIQNEIKSLVKKAGEIDKIKLGRPENKNQPSNNFGGISIPIVRSSFNSLHPRYVEIEEQEILTIQTMSKELLDLELNNSFFHTGNLKEPPFRTPSIYGSSEPEYIGNKDELKKINLFKDFSRELKDLNDLLNYWKKLMIFRIIPIVLRNDGNVLNESIDIQLHFSDQIEILEPKNFPAPERINTLKKINSSDGILSFFLKHNKDSKVKEYNYGFSGIGFPTPSFPFSQTVDEKRKKEKDKYYDLLTSLFDYEVFYDSKDKIIIACNIEAIKPNDSVSLPCYLMTKNEDGFMIDYEINSKNLPSKINGTLLVKGISQIS